VGFDIAYALSQKAKEKEKTRVLTASRAGMSRKNTFGQVLFIKRESKSEKKDGRIVSTLTTAHYETNKNALNRRTNLDTEHDNNQTATSSLMQVNNDKTFEQNSHIIAHIKAFSQKDDDINRLLKKLTLSFSANKHESQFVIDAGVFKGARFLVTTNDKDLSLGIINASPEAKVLIHDHHQLLKNRLAMREINLKAVQFKFC